MSEPIGWYVRVKTGHVIDGVHDSMLYIAGYPTPAEAEAAVRNARVRIGARLGEQYEVTGAVVTGRGPQPEPGEVRILRWAV